MSDTPSGSTPVADAPPASAAATTAPVDPWVVYITPFATTVGKTVDEVSAMLSGVVGEPGEQAIALLKDASLSPDADIKAALNGTPVAVMNKAIRLLREVPAQETAVPLSAATFDVLPNVPSDESWLSALKVGGILKFSKETVSGTVSAALAARVGLYDLPQLIVNAMERHAESLDEPVGSDFYAMQRALTERSYAEIFAAIPGATGRYATQARKNELLHKMETLLWPALVSFQQQLTGWVDSWTKTAGSPAAMMSALASLAGSGPRIMPPGVMQVPPIDQLRDAAESVITSINKIFAGTGSLVAMALAYDALQIRTALENPALPIQVGAANREQMLRLLNVAVASDYPRLEQSLKKYTLGVIDLPNVSAGETEQLYVGALYQLGAMIPWERLNGPQRAGIGTGSSRRGPGALS